MGATLGAIASSSKVPRATASPARNGAQFLAQFARQRMQRVLAGFAFAAGLDEGVRTALVHQQHAAGIVEDHRGDDADGGQGGLRRR